MVQNSLMFELFAALRLVRVPQRLENGKPANFWEEAPESLANEQAKRLHVLLSQFTEEAAEAHLRSDLETTDKIQSRMRICEEWLRYLVCEEFDLFGKIRDKPVIYGNWKVAYKPVAEVELGGRLNM